MSKEQPLQGHRDLKVYRLAYKLAMEIFEASKEFPKEEKYSPTDQIRLHEIHPGEIHPASAAP